MSIKTSACVSESVWHAVERAIRNRLPLHDPAKAANTEQMLEWFAGAVIWDVARQLDAAGVRVPEEC